MKIGISVDNIVTDLGNEEFFYAFFSTVQGRLEPDGWGTKFPVIMNDLYKGSLTPNQTSEAIEEITQIQEELRDFKPDQIIWNIEKRDLQPPWGKNISPDVTDLSNYFITSTGRDLIEEILDNLEYANEHGLEVKIDRAK